MTRDEFLVKLKEYGLYGEIYLDPQGMEEYDGVDIFNNEDKDEILAIITDDSMYSIQTLPAWSEIGVVNRSKKFRLFYDYIATPICERY